MPPKPAKDAKDGKKKGNQKKKPECLVPPEVKPPDTESPEFYLLQIADLERRVVRYQDQYLILVEKNAGLQKTFDDTVANRKALVEEAKKKYDDRLAEIASLGREADELQNLINKEKSEFEEKVLSMTIEYTDMEEQLASQLNDIRDTLARIDQFKSDRDVLLEQIVELEEEMLVQAEIHKQEIDEMERKHIESKNKLKKDIANKLTDVAADFRQAADAALPQTTRRTLLENYQINMRVTEMTKETSIVDKENKKLLETVVRQKHRTKNLQSIAEVMTKKNVANMKLLSLLKGKQVNEITQMIRYRPADSEQFQSLGELIAAMHLDLKKSRETLYMANEQRDQLQLETFDSRRELALQKHIMNCLCTILHDVSWTIRELVTPNPILDCKDIEEVDLPIIRSNTIESFLAVLNIALDLGIGPHVGDVTVPVDPDLRVELSQQGRPPPLTFQTGDWGLIPRAHYHAPTNVEKMQKIRKEQKKATKVFVGQMQTQSDKLPSIVTTAYYAEGDVKEILSVSGMSRMLNLLPSKSATAMPAVIASNVSISLLPHRSAISVASSADEGGSKTNLLLPSTAGSGLASAHLQPFRPVHASSSSHISVAPRN